MDEYGAFPYNSDEELKENMSLVMSRAYNSLKDKVVGKMILMTHVGPASSFTTIDKSKISYKKAVIHTGSPSLDDLIDLYQE